MNTVLVDQTVQASPIVSGSPVAYPVALGMTSVIGLIRVTEASVPPVVWASVQLPVHKTPEVWVLADKPPVGCGSDCALYARRRGDRTVFAYLHKHADRVLPPESTGRWVPEPSGSWSRPHMRPARTSARDPRPGWQGAYDMSIDDVVRYPRGATPPTTALMEVRIVTSERQTVGLDAPVTRILMRSPVDLDAGLVLVTYARPEGGYRTVLIDTVEHAEIVVFEARKLTRKRALTRHFGALAHIKRGGAPESFAPVSAEE